MEAYLNGPLNIIDMLGVGVADGQPVASTEEQVLLHRHVAVHDVILHKYHQVTQNKSAWQAQTCSTRT